MSHQLNFAHLLTYDTESPGINLEVTLSLKHSSLAVQTKLDTGSEGSIFTRKLGEQLGLLIENGIRQPFSTATGSFVAYGHSVTMKIADIEFDTIVHFAQDDSFNRQVIGRFGGLEHLRIGIVDYEGKLYLSDYNDE